MKSLKPYALQLKPFHPIKQNITGCLCSSGFAFFQSATVFVTIDSLAAVKLAATQMRVEGLQVFNIVSNN